MRGSWFVTSLFVGLRNQFSLHKNYFSSILWGEANFRVKLLFDLFILSGTYSLIPSLIHSVDKFCGSTMEMDKKEDDLRGSENMSVEMLKVLDPFQEF